MSGTKFWEAEAQGRPTWESLLGPLDCDSAWARPPFKGDPRLPALGASSFKAAMRFLVASLVSYTDLVWNTWICHFLKLQHCWCWSFVAGSVKLCTCLNVLLTAESCIYWKTGSSRVFIHVWILGVCVYLVVIRVIHSERLMPCIMTIIVFLGPESSRVAAKSLTSNAAGGLPPSTREWFVTPITRAKPWRISKPFPHPGFISCYTCILCFILLCLHHVKCLWTINQSCIDLLGGIGSLSGALASNKRS